MCPSLFPRTVAVYTQLHTVNYTRAGGRRCVARVISGICDFVSVRTLKDIQLELSTPNVVHFVAGHPNALTARSRYLSCWFFLTLSIDLGLGQSTKYYIKKVK